jgi:ribosome biogenesis ATPase
VTRIFDTLGDDGKPSTSTALAAAAITTSPEEAEGAEAGPSGKMEGAVGGTLAGGGGLLPHSRFGAGPLRVEELSGLAITMSDFEAAIGKVQPSLRREGFTTTPDVTWDDVGSLDEVRSCQMPGVGVHP